MRRLLVVIVAGAAGALAPSTAHASVRTVARIYRPFTASGNPTLATRTRHGSCFSGSIAADRDDAWRCTVGNLIADPCFSSPRARTIVLCPGRDLRFALKIVLIKGLPHRYADRSRPSLRRHPWNLQLLDGEHCVFLTGASSVAQGRRANYVCERSPDALWGVPARGTRPWSILSAPFTAKRLHERRLIRRAWM